MVSQQKVRHSFICLLVNVITFISQKFFDKFRLRENIKVLFLPNFVHPRKAANQFSLVETNAAFVHRKWAAIYEAQLPRRALKLAAALPHCQAGLGKTRV
jgi:hypothetical protein